MDGCPAVFLGSKQVLQRPVFAAKSYLSLADKDLNFVQLLTLTGLPVACRLRQHGQLLGEPLVPEVADDGWIEPTLALFL